MEGTEHSNALAYRRTAEAFRSGDLTLLESLIDPAVVWHVPGGHAMAGDIHGRDALVEWCAMSTMGARRDGVDVCTRVVSIFHYRDGLQAERWFYPEDSAAWDTIFGDRV